MAVVALRTPKKIGDWLGVCGPFPGQPSVADDLAWIASLGVNIVRGDALWPTIERDRGTFHLEAITDWAAEARLHRLTPCVTFSYAPRWAAANDKAAPRLADVDAYAEFVYAVCAALKPVHPRGFVVEGWNEWNVNHFFDPPSPNLYVRLQAALACAAKAANPRNVVITGGTAPAPTTAEKSYAPLDAYAGYLAAGGTLRACDGWAHHPYTWSYDPFDSSRRHADWNSLAVVERLVALLPARLRVWATEAGWPTGRRETDLPKVLRWWFDQPRTGPFVLYHHRDLNTGSANPHHALGLRTADGREKPAAEAVRRIAVEPLVERSL